MLWALEKPARLLQERASLENLAGEEAWIQSLRWGFTKEALLKVDVDLAIGDDIYDVELVYPKLFPDTPAFVLPRTSTARWSSHQYGPGGVLCLEWGPDNWNPEITGVDLLRSAYKLLSTERGHGTTTSVVPSRHKLSFGQNIGASTRRLIITPELAKFLGSVPPQSQHYLLTRCVSHDSTNVLFISEISREAGQSFRSSDLPSGISNYFPLFSSRGEGWLFKSDAFNSSESVSNMETLISVIHNAGFNVFSFPSRDEGKSTNIEQLFLMIGQDGQARALTAEIHGDGSVKEYVVIDACDANEQRLPLEHQSLSEKRIGIVGLGSVGSKVAISLARSGVRKFLLVDDDVMLGENVCRHELDWASVGVNKVEAVKETLSLIVPGVEVQTRRTRIAGQESAQSASTLLDSLAACDLLIDATANASVFVQLAAIVKRRKIPLVWGEIFAGGIGALLLRSRPEKDPEPLSMRAGVYRHLESLPPAPFSNAVDYDAVENDVPMIAFDAEVSQFAATLTRFAIDSLIDRTPPEFPYSAYLIGFKQAWIFEAPFYTLPIIVNLPTGETANPLSVQPEECRQAVNVLVDLINQQTNVDANPTG